MSDQEPLPVLISAEEIQKKVVEIAAGITADYIHEPNITVIGALKGSFMFMSDLVRRIEKPLYVDFIEASSYGDEMESSGIVKITKDLRHSIKGENVIVVEDIIDTGLTLNYLMESFQLRKPKSLRLAALLVKEEKQQCRYHIDYRGFNIDDKFVVGYGMDYRGFYRNLDHVAYIEKESQLKFGWES